MNKLYISCLALMCLFYTVDGVAQSLNDLRVMVIDDSALSLRGGGDCSVGSISVSPLQSICPGESATYNLTDFSIPDGGGMGVIFIAAGGTGGADNLALLGIQNVLPLPVNHELNGILAQNQLQPFEGDWLLFGVVYQDEEDVEGSICAEADFEDFVLISFLTADDAACGGTFVEPVSTHPVLDFGVYPNPANDVLNLNIRTSSAQVVDLQLIALSGEVVHRENRLVHGDMNVVMDVADLAPGMYFARMSAPSHNETIKVIVGAR
jgi:hypothetical protein